MQEKKIIIKTKYAKTVILCNNIHHRDEASLIHSKTSSSRKVTGKI